MNETVSMESLANTIKSLDQIIRRHITALETNYSSTKNCNLNDQPLKQIQHDNIVKVANPKRNFSIADLGELYTETFKKREKVTVYVRITFLKIGVIDTIHDRYSAEILIQTKWREQSLDGLKNIDDVDFESCWNPKVTIANGIGELKYTTSIFAEQDKSNRVWLCERKKANGQFFEFMELNKFPFDGQDLTVTVTSEQLDSVLEFKQDELAESSVNTGAFSAAQEWALHDKINIWTKVNIKVVNKKKIKYPCFCAAAKVARRPQFFIYNIIIIMFSICSLAFATFTVKMETPESRLPLTFFLVLTTVTFKFVVNKSLPKISYLTYMDKYILGSMVILCLVCIWHSISGSLINTWTQIIQPVIQTTPIQNINKTSITVVIKNVTATPAVEVSCVSLKNPPSTKLGKLIDNVALAFFAFVYIVFHLLFLFFIVANKEDDSVNESNLNMDDGEDDESEANQKKNTAIIALGIFGAHKASNVQNADGSMNLKQQQINHSQTNDNMNILNNIFNDSLSKGKNDGSFFNGGYQNEAHNAKKNEIVLATVQE